MKFIDRSSYENDRAFIQFVITFGVFLLVCLIAFEIALFFMGFYE